MATTTETGTKLLRSHNRLGEDTRSAMVTLLNRRLAETLDLYTQIKQSHWNVQGPNFYQLHLLFDQLAGEIFPFVDEIAERVTALGGVAAGTARMAAKSSGLRENDLGAADGRKHVDLLVDRYASYAEAVREAIEEADKHGDKDTADLFTQVSRAADKHLWFLEAHTR
jgi:starvation-inducible DNA-binding protein